MDEFYTKVKKNDNNAVKRPKQQTIDFLKQFARICAYERMLSANMGGYSANWNRVVSFFEKELILSNCLRHNQGVAGNYFFVE